MLLDLAWPYSVVCKRRYSSVWMVGARLCNSRQSAWSADCQTKSFGLKCTCWHLIKLFCGLDSDRSKEWPAQQKVLPWAPDDCQLANQIAHNFWTLTTACIGIPVLCWYYISWVSSCVCTEHISKAVLTFRMADDSIGTAGRLFCTCSFACWALLVELHFMNCLQDKYTICLNFGSWYAVMMKVFQSLKPL